MTSTSVLYNPPFFSQDWFYEKRESISFISSTGIIIFALAMNLMPFMNRKPIKVASEMLAVLENLPIQPVEKKVEEKKVEEKKIEKRVEKSQIQPVEKTITTPVATSEPSPEKVVQSSVATQKSEPVSTPSKPISEPTNSSSVSAQYEAMLRAYLEKIKRYPSSREARLARPEGTVKVVLELTRTGELVAISILESSGFNLLDSETIKTIKSGTFPPFPEAAFVNQSSHKFIANMKYTVSSN